MSTTIEDRLSELGLTLPTPSAPAANYIPYTLSGRQIIISGQIPMGPNGIEYIGRCGENMDVETAKAAAQLCGLNLLAQAKAAAGGSLDNVRALKLGGFVNSTADFTEQPAVVNGASDLMVAVLGEHGRHARSAVGVANLPFGVGVEVEGMFELLA